MARLMAAVLCGAVFLAGCGGAPAPGGAPGLPGGGDYKGKMPDAMKPCDDANKETVKAIPSFKSGKLTLNETKAVADLGVAACEASLAAWQGLNIPAPVTEPCLGEARAKRDLASAMRAGLDHQMSKPYKTRVDRNTDWVTKQVAACKKALNGG